jgi:hypothetical protein
MPRHGFRHVFGENIVRSLLLLFKSSIVFRFDGILAKQEDVLHLLCFVPADEFDPNFASNERLGPTSGKHPYIHIVFEIFVQSNRSVANSLMELNLIKYSKAI